MAHFNLQSLRALQNNEWSPGLKEAVSQQLPGKDHFAELFPTY